MEKNQIIAFIQEQLASGKITTSDLSNLSKGTPAPASGEIKSSHLINIFYTIGALIVLTGIVLLFAQHWDEIGFVGRLAVTLGIGFVGYIMGLVLRTDEHSVLSQVLLTVSAVLVPMGIVIFCNEMDIRLDLTNQIWISLGLLCMYTVAYMANKKNILIILNIGWATWTYWVVLLKILDVGYDSYDILKWALMLLGVVYILIARGLADTMSKERDAVKNILYFLGTLGILSGGISIGGLFDLVFILVIFAGFYFSIYIKNRGVLMLSSLFLLIHLGKITSEYFSDWFSWPILLILGGAIVMGIGYFTYYINKKYIKSA